MFLPTTRAEMIGLGWDALDIILVTGDTYIDSPFTGIAVVGKVLMDAGYRVGIIAQPDIHTADDITRLGEPQLFWGVSGGCVDSMVANFTASKKRRRQDDFTPGGENNRRPDRAVIVYTNLIKRYFKDTSPIVLGGIEASLRRVAHYDFWSDSIRRSILFDAKADVLVYGMAEKTILQLAAALQAGLPIAALPGLCVIEKEKRGGYIELPAYELVVKDKHAFIEMFHTFYLNNDPLSAKGLYQRHGDRYLVQNPPNAYLSQPELDAVYGLDYERDAHPFYKQQGDIRALETIAFSLVTHRGCYGECNFCAIAVHEGRTVRWRTSDAIVEEARQLTQHPEFKGYIQDVSGPTANMYGFECRKKLEHGACADRRCLYPEICPNLKPDHSHQITLLRRLRRLKGVKKVFVSSGVRYDLLLADTQHGSRYLRELVNHHVSGQMKVAPEHSEDRVLARMGKPGRRSLVQFKNMFYKMTKAAGKPQFLTYYLIAAHPGCTDQDMARLRAFASRELKVHPEQVQIFTPTPSTYSSLMYYTEMDPFTGKRLYVEKDLSRKRRQKAIVVRKHSAKRRTPTSSKRRFRRRSRRS